LLVKFNTFQHYSIEKWVIKKADESSADQNVVPQQVENNKPETSSS